MYGPSSNVMALLPAEPLSPFTVCISPPPLTVSAQRASWYSGAPETLLFSRTEWKHDLAEIAPQDEREHKTPPVRTSAHQKAVIDAPPRLQANANTKRKQGEQGSTIEQRVRSTLANHPNLSDRELAAIVGVSPSTANKWRKRIEQSAA